MDTTVEKHRENPNRDLSCSHRERKDGVCIVCGHCLHEIILNGLCYFCGSSAIDGAAISPRPQDQLISADRLIRRGDGENNQR